MSEERKRTGPRFASLLLEGCVPAGELPDLLGDLEEVFRARVRKYGRARARIWYIGQLVQLRIWIGVERLRARIGTLRRNRRIVRDTPPFGDTYIHRKTGWSSEELWMHLRLLKCLPLGW